MKTRGIEKYHSILVECDIEGLGGDRSIYFDYDLNRLFTEFSSSLKQQVSTFIDFHSEYFAWAELEDYYQEYPNLGLNPEEPSFDDSLKILDHILDKGKLSFIAGDEDDSFFEELNGLLDWVSSVPSYPNNDYVHIPIQGSYPGFIEQWYRYETRGPMLPPEHYIGIEHSPYGIEDAALIGWLNILWKSPGWHEKNDAVKFVRQLVHQFNDRFEFH
jgi:hypothetical protein